MVVTGPITREDQVLMQLIQITMLCSELQVAWVMPCKIFGFIPWWRPVTKLERALASALLEELKGRGVGKR